MSVLIKELNRLGCNTVNFVWLLVPTLPSYAKDGKNSLLFSNDDIERNLFSWVVLRVLSVESKLSNRYDSERMNLYHEYSAKSTRGYLNCVNLSTVNDKFGVHRSTIWLFLGQTEASRCYLSSVKARERWCKRRSGRRWKDMNKVGAEFKSTSFNQSTTLQATTMTIGALMMAPEMHESRLVQEWRKTLKVALHGPKLLVLKYRAQW